MGVTLNKEKNMENLILLPRESEVRFPWLRRKLYQLLQIAGILAVLASAWWARDTLLELCGRSGVCPTITKIETVPEVKEVYKSRKFTKEQRMGFVRSESLEQGLPEVVGLAIANQESAMGSHREFYNAQKKVNPKDYPPEWQDEVLDPEGRRRAITAIGIMGVMPLTAYERAKEMGETIGSMQDLYDAPTNARYGVRHAKHCLGTKMPGANGALDNLARCYFGNGGKIIIDSQGRQYSMSTMREGWKVGVSNYIFNSLFGGK